MYKAKTRVFVTVLQQLHKRRECYSCVNISNYHVALHWHCWWHGQIFPSSCVHFIFWWCTSQRASGNRSCLSQYRNIDLCLRQKKHFWTCDIKDRRFFFIPVTPLFWSSFFPLPKSVSALVVQKLKWTQISSCVCVCFYSVLSCPWGKKWLIHGYGPALLKATLRQWCSEIAYRILHFKFCNWFWSVIAGGLRYTLTLRALGLQAPDPLG